MSFEDIPSVAHHNRWRRGGNTHSGWHMAMMRGAQIIEAKNEISSPPGQQKGGQGEGEMGRGRGEEGVRVRVGADAGKAESEESEVENTEIHRLRHHLKRDRSSSTENQ